MTSAVSYYNNNSEVNIALYLNILKTTYIIVCNWYPVGTPGLINSSNFCRIRFNFQNSRTFKFQFSEMLNQHLSLSCF